MLRGFVDLQLAEIDREVNTMKRLEHPNIVRLLDAQHQGSRIHIVMEFCSGGTLSKYCKQFPDNKPPLETTRTFLKAIVGALEYLHKEHVIHRGIVDSLLCGEFFLGIQTLYLWSV